MKKIRTTSLFLLSGFLIVHTPGSAVADTDGLYQYRPRQPVVEVYSVVDDSIPLKPVHLRPPIRPLLTPPIAQEALPAPQDVPTIKAEVPPAVVPDEQTPRQLAKPFFTASPVEEPVEEETVVTEIAPVKTAEAVVPAPPVPKPAEKVQIPVEKPIVAEKAPVADNAPEIEEQVVEKPALPAAEQPAEAAPVTPVEVTSVPAAPPVPAPAPDMKPAEVAAVPAAPVVPPVPAAVPAHTDMMIVFDKNSSTLTPEAEKSVAAIAAQLTDLPDTRLQIRAFASGEDGTPSSARRMSLSRALMVRSFITDKGIKPIRLDVRALGSETDTQPVDRVDLVFVK